MSEISNSNVANENIIGNTFKPFVTTASWQTLKDSMSTPTSIKNGFILSIPQIKETINGKEELKDKLYESSIWVTDNDGNLYPVSLPYEKLKNKIKEDNLLDELRYFVYKYDFDGDGKVTNNDQNIILKHIYGQLSDDPSSQYYDSKYNSINHTYNGKTLNISGDTDDNGNPIINVTDNVAFINRVSEIINKIKTELGKYIELDIKFNTISSNTENDEEDE